MRFERVGQKVPRRALGGGHRALPEMVPSRRGCLLFFPSAERFSLHAVVEAFRGVRGEEVSVGSAVVVRSPPSRPTTTLARATLASFVPMLAARPTRLSAASALVLAALCLSLAVAEARVEVRPVSSTVVLDNFSVRRFKRRAVQRDFCRAFTDVIGLEERVRSAPLEADIAARETATATATATARLARPFRFSLFREQKKKPKNPNLPLTSPPPPPYFCAVLQDSPRLPSVPHVFRELRRPLRHLRPQVRLRGLDFRVRQASIRGSRRRAPRPHATQRRVQRCEPRQRRRRRARRRQRRYRGPTGTGESAGTARGSAPGRTGRSRGGRGRGR